MASGQQGTGRRFRGGALIEHAQEGRRIARTPRTERERLQSLAGFGVVDSGREPEFDAIARLAARLAGTQAAAITFVDAGSEHVKAVAGAELPDVSRARAFGGEMVARGAALVVRDALEHDRFAANPWVTDAPQVRFYAGVPIVAGGLVMGALAVMDPEPRDASGDLLATLDDIVSALMPQLERRREEVMAQNLTAVVAFDGRFQRVSPAFENVLGWRAEEMIGRHCLEFVHPDDANRESARIERLAGGYRGQGGFESRYRAKAGGYRWLLWDSQAVPYEKRLYCAAMDITDRKRNEMGLRESEARYRMLAENATDIVSGHDLDGRITYVSSAVQGLTGWRVDELIGRDPFDLFHGADVDHAREAHKRLLERMQPVRYVYRLRRKDGSWLWVESNARVVRDERSRPVGIQSATRDVTEMKGAAEAAERANRAKSEFLARMSHELRTPLNAVLGFAQLVEADDDLSDPQRESIGRVLSGGYHLLTLVNEVLDMSAIEAGGLPIVAERVHVAPLVRAAVDLVRPQADERSIRLRCDLPAADVVLAANARRLKQVLLNLIANAVKYSPPQSEVSVVVRAGEEGRARIDVIDTGPGIPAGAIDRAFVPFERLGTPDEVEGTGLGLPLSLNLVEGMDGTLTVESGSGGSAFTVELPLAENEAGAPKGAR